MGHVTTLADAVAELVHDGDMVAREGFTHLISVRRRPRDSGDGELMLVSVHPGVTVDDVRAATGWDLRVASVVGVAPAPSPAGLQALRAMTADGVE